MPRLAGRAIRQTYLIKLPNYGIIASGIVGICGDREHRAEPSVCQRHMSESSDLEGQQGKTPSERYLARLARKTFLNLWSYPNVYIDKKQNGRGVGKELCDLLVVCGDHVLIFSDKHISWPETDDVEWRGRDGFARPFEAPLTRRGAQSDGSLIFRSGCSVIQTVRSRFR